MESLDKAAHIINMSFRTFVRYPLPVHVDEVQILPSTAAKIQYKDHPQLWYCRDGGYTHETEHGTYFCQKGSLVLVPPGVAHCLRIPDGGKAVLLRVILPFDYLSALPFDAAPGTATLLFLPPFLREQGVSLPDHYILSESSRSIAEECFVLLTSEKQEEARKRASLEHILSLPELSLPSFIIDAADAAFTARLSPVLRVLEYIQSNYSRKITAEHLCQVSSLCRTNLFRLVRQYLGISWASYLVMLRVIRANYALVHTGYSVAYIADMCGFTHSSHMSKCYKKYKGILPKDDRARQKLYQQRYGKLHITHEFFMDDFFD